MLYYLLYLNYLLSCCSVSNIIVVLMQMYQVFCVLFLINFSYVSIEVISHFTWQYVASGHISGGSISVKRNIILAGLSHGHH